MKKPFNRFHIPSSLPFGTLAVIAASLSLSAGPARSQGSDATGWKSTTISPVANPIYFEDPMIDSEVRPLYMYHALPGVLHVAGTEVPVGGEVQVFALQLRYALSSRLAFIVTKDGYIEARPARTLQHRYGWGNITAGFKYAAIDDEANQFIVTPGVTLEVPIGAEGVFQGHGDGLWNLFASAEKGFDRFHVTGNAGFLLPDNFGRQSAEAHYSLQLDYCFCPYFTPFVVGNAYTVLSDGGRNYVANAPLNYEFNDLADVGSTQARGTTQLILGGGIRTRLAKSLDVGFAYEFGATRPEGIFADRYTVDLIWRF